MSYTGCFHRKRWTERCILCEIEWAQGCVERAKESLKRETAKLEALKMERRAEKAGVLERVA